MLKTAQSRSPSALWDMGTSLTCEQRWVAERGKGEVEAFTTEGKFFPSTFNLYLAEGTALSIVTFRRNNLLRQKSWVLFDIWILKMWVDWAIICIIWKENVHLITQLTSKIKYVVWFNCGFPSELKALKKVKKTPQIHEALGEPYFTA